MLHCLLIETVAIGWILGVVSPASILVPRPRPRRVGIEDYQHQRYQHHRVLNAIILLNTTPVLFFILVPTPVVHQYCLYCPRPHPGPCPSRPSPPAPEGWDKDITLGYNPTSSYSMPTNLNTFQYSTPHVPCSVLVHHLCSSSLAC